MCYVFSPFTALETIPTSLWASLHHHFPVLSVFSHVSCQFIFFISSRVLSIHIRLGRPLILFPGTTMSIIFIERLSSSLLLMCPYQFNIFCLRNVDIWHTLAHSCMIWFLTVCYVGLYGYYSMYRLKLNEYPSACDHHMISPSTHRSLCVFTRRSPSMLRLDMAARPTI